MPARFAPGRGGGSFYKGEAPREPQESFETLVSLDRPDAAASRPGTLGHTGLAEAPIHRFLQARAVPYRQIADLDLHRDGAALAACRLLAITTHAEYWTRERVERPEAFLGAGGSVLNPSGNVLWWKVTLDGSRMECRKDRGRPVRGLHQRDGVPG